MLKHGFFTLIALLVFSRLNSVEAQNPTQEIYSRIPTNLSWSSDSSSLAFQEGGFGWEGVQAKWYEYTINTEILTELDTWPYQPSLAPDEIAQFDIATDENGQMSFILPSPDNRFIVYAATRPASWGDRPFWPLGLADLQTSEYCIFEDIHAEDLTNFGRTYAVRWAEDSRSFTVFTISAYGSAQQVFYFTNLEAGINNLTYRSLLSGEIIPEDENLYIWDSFDISDDGNRLLLSNLVILPDNVSGNQLVVWDSLHPRQSKYLMEGNIVEASFVGEGDQQLLVITGDGIVLYDLVAKSMTILDNNIDADYLYDAWISPNGEYIAYYDYYHADPNNGLFVAKINLPE